MSAPFVARAAVVTLLVGATSAATGCTSAGQRGYSEILAVEAFEGAGPGTLLIDLRNASERQREGSPAGSVSIPYGFPDSFVARVGAAAGHRRATPIVVICRAGAISRSAAEALASRGFTNVASVSDGFGGSIHGPGWKAWGLPIE